MKKMYSIIVVLLLLIQTIPCLSKEPAVINLKDIPQRKVRSYLIINNISKIQDFSAIRPSWKKGFINSDFNIQEKNFYLDYCLSSVWECYRHVNSIDMWSGKSVRFGVLLSKPSNSVVYADNPSSPEIDTGQIYFLNLRLIKGLINIPVAFEIINIDQVHQLIEFSYIESNKSKGKQTIQFFESGNGHTRIVHTSFFKSGSRFRDNLIYPVFHKKFIREFHRNMLDLIGRKENQATIFM